MVGINIQQELKNRMDDWKLYKKDGYGDMIERHLDYYEEHNIKPKPIIKDKKIEDTNITKGQSPPNNTTPSETSLKEEEQSFVSATSPGAPPQNIVSAVTPADRALAEGAYKDSPDYKESMQLIKSTVDGMTPEALDKKEEDGN